MSATVRLYNLIRAELLPTPSRSHYTFNLRDLSKVVQGVMRADPRSTSDKSQVGFLTLRNFPPSGRCLLARYAATEPFIYLKHRPERNRTH